MSWMKVLGASVLLQLVLLGGCSGERAHRMLDAESTESAQRDAGYTLLITLLGDESRVDGILMIKSLPGPVSRLVERISVESRSGRRKLVEALENPPLVTLGNDGLPLVEVGARRLIRQWTTMELLAGRGASLERALLISQLQAVDSIRALSETLRDQEASAERTAILDSLLDAFTPIRAEIWEQLGVIGD